MNDRLLSFSAVNKMTLLDYPEHLAAMVFTQGCNFRCFYCHNPVFVKGGEERAEISSIPFQAVENFLKSRKNFLDGVVISGGEPTLHKNLKETISRIKALGYKVKLDTNGSRPAVVEELLKEGLIDYLAMDFKCLPDDYEQICCFQVSPDLLRESVALAMSSGIPYEFRTTVWEEYHTLETLQAMGEWIKGAREWALQNLRKGELLGNSEEATPYNPARLQNYREPLSAFAETISVR